MLSTLNVRSQAHNSCEDSIFAKETGDFIWGCVCDGCSTGLKSHFASQCICYIVENNGLHDLNICSNYSIQTIIHDLRRIKNIPKLSNMNFLSTCLLFFYDKVLKELHIRIFGDGYYYVNGVEFKIDQNNTPNYIGYHLEDTNEDKNKYIEAHPVVIHHGVENFMVCSDGIKSIERGAFLENAKLDPNALLFSAPTTENYLTRMWNKIKRDGFTLSDDLSIVSYVS